MKLIYPRPVIFLQQFVLYFNSKNWTKFNFIHSGPSHQLISIKWIWQHRPVWLSVYLYSAFTCFGQLWPSSEGNNNMLSNYYYIDHNTYCTVLAVLVRVYRLHHSIIHTPLLPTLLVGLTSILLHSIPTPWCRVSERSLDVLTPRRLADNSLCLPSSKASVELLLMSFLLGG
jgi:hypothetical protein